jgi:phosphoserine phosphatase
MHHVVTLIADPAKPVLDHNIAIAAAGALKSEGAPVGPVDMLAPGVACDIPFVSDVPPGAFGRAEAIVRVSLGRAPIDVAVQPMESRRKRLLACDMDSTLIENEIVDEIAAVAGIRDKIAPITARAVAGEIDFATSLAERAALLKGLPAERYLSAAAAISPMPGARTLMATMRAHGARTMIISGGFRAFTARVRDLLGMDEDVSNDVEIVDGVLTGRLVPPVLHRDRKAEVLREAAAAHGIPISLTMAVGDGANDAAMIAAAGTGVAFHAKGPARQAAAVRIDHGDLTALLYLQGFRAADIRIML